MKKVDFVALVAAVIGGFTFAIGMVMALLPEWHMFNTGVVLAVIGAVVLVGTWLTRRIALGLKFPKINWRKLGLAIYTVFSVLVFGAGMALTMI